MYLMEKKIIWDRKNKENGGEEGIRTLETGQTAYSLSRGAPSTTRPPLRRQAYIKMPLLFKGFMTLI